MSEDYFGQRAVRVTFETSNIKVAGDEDEIPLVPHVPARFFLGAWKNFCREFYPALENADIIFSDGVGDKKVGVEYEMRGRNRINRGTGTADKVFSEILVYGRFSVIMRFPPLIRDEVELFIQSFENGFSRIGKNRSTHGDVEVLSYRFVGIKYAERLAKAATQSVQREIIPNEQIKELVDQYSLRGVDQAELRLTLFPIFFGNGPVAGQLIALSQSGKRGRPLLVRQPPKSWDGDGPMLGFRLVEIIKDLPDEARKEFLLSLLKESKEVNKWISVGSAEGMPQSPT